MQVPPKKFYIYGPSPSPTGKEQPIAENGVAPSSAKGIADGLKEAGVPAENVVVSHDMGKLLEHASKAARQLKNGEGGAGKPVLVMPGGTAPFIAVGIPKITQSTLKHLLQEGAVNYVGVCAGCYLAAQKWASKGRSQPMLGLVAGLPTLERRVMDKPLPAGQFPSEELQLKQEGSEGTYAVRWHGGPRFEDDEPIPGYKVLATADDARLRDHDPAIVSMRSGQGEVTLSSVHPEYPLANEGPGVARDKRLEVFRTVFGLPQDEA